MSYDIEFLKKHELMTDPKSGIVRIDDQPIEYLYSPIHKMIYVTEKHDIQEDRIYDYLRANLMFDFLWIGGNAPVLYRTYGGLSKYEFTRELDGFDKLTNLTPTTIFTIFEKKCEIFDTIEKQIPGNQDTIDARIEISQTLLDEFIQTIHNDGVQSISKSEATFLLGRIYESIICPIVNMKNNGFEVFTSSKGMRRQNRKTGSYYTPEYLARDIVSRCLSTWLLKETGLDIEAPDLSQEAKERALTCLRKIRVIDPAVGGGAFLLATAQWLVSARIILGDKASEEDIRFDVIKNNIFGVDIMEGAVKVCKTSLLLWAGKYESSRIDTYSTIKVGNSLRGHVKRIIREESNNDDGFHWYLEFKDIMNSGGFDVVIGNPPYGNILSTEEKRFISEEYGHHVSGGRSGTWNSASLFIVRSKMIMNNDGVLGLLLPNSILRVGQFTKTRKYILEDLGLFRISDEGSAFQSVTLEMVSVFCHANPAKSTSDVTIFSRRPKLFGISSVPRDNLTTGKMFVIYSDDLYLKILRKGKRGILCAGRGRDIPHSNTSKEQNDLYKFPYATSGRSIKRYQIDYTHIIYTDEWFQNDKVLLDSFESEFLISTKNYPYPRCVMKPKGLIHGGGAVRIWISDETMKPKAIGLILNSRMIRLICSRYLTNGSQLTTCLNTGIMDELPILYPSNDEPFVKVFKLLQDIHQRGKFFDDTLDFIERIADALVYSLYLLDEIEDMQNAFEILSSIREGHDEAELQDLFYSDTIQGFLNEVYNNPIVSQIEELLGQ